MILANGEKISHIFRVCRNINNSFDKQMIAKNLKTNEFLKRV